MKSLTNSLLQLFGKQLCFFFYSNDYYFEGIIIILMTDLFRNRLGSERLVVTVM